MKDTIEFFRNRKGWYEIENKNLWIVFSLLIFGLSPTILSILNLTEPKISYTISAFLIAVVLFVGWVSFVERINVI